MLQSFYTVRGPSACCSLIQQLRTHSYDDQFHPLPFVVYTRTYGRVPSRPAPAPCLEVPRARLWAPELSASAAGSELLSAARNGTAQRGAAGSQTRGNGAGGSAYYLLQHTVPSRQLRADRERELRFRQAFLTAAGRSAAAGARTPSGEGVSLRPTGTERLASAAPLAIPALFPSRPGQGAGT